MHTRDEIAQYVRAHSPNANMISPEVFTGAIRDLVLIVMGHTINPT